MPDVMESALLASIRNGAQELGTIPWSLIARETAADASLGHILQSIEQGNTRFDNSNSALVPLWPACESFYVHDGVLLYQDRVVVPSSLRNRILRHLHVAHQGTSTMEQRAQAIVYWPGMSQDIRETRKGCTNCNRNAPSQAATPPLPSPPPSTPFEAVFADFFDYGGCHYLIVGDRLSGWVEILSSSAGTDSPPALLLCHVWCPRCVIAGNTEKFLRLWGVRHGLSSVGFPQSNGRAEVAVKTAKRLLMSDTGPTSNLDHDRFLRAILQLRNTPDPDSNLSPAQIIFSHPLRDGLTFVNKLDKFSNPHVHPLWRHAWAAKEEALWTRIALTTESLKAHSKPLRPLSIGEQVFLQNQQGHHPTKWDRSGTVVESTGHDQYRVKVDGSGRLTLQNCRFLQAYPPATPFVSQEPTAAPHLPRIGSHSQPPHPRAPKPQSNTLPQVGVESSPVDTPTAEDPQAAVASPPVDAPTAEDPTPTSPTTVLTDHSCPATSSAPGIPTPKVPPTTPVLDKQSRPSRHRHPPKHYEPETGKWIER